MGAQVRLLIVEAPGVLFPIDQVPPNADPITSGLRFVRSLTEGYGVGVLLVAHLHGVPQPEDALNAWTKMYDVEHGWRVATSDSTPVDFWKTQVTTMIGKLRATPVLAVTSHTLVAQYLATVGIPTMRFYAPDGSAPDWGPATSSWANVAPASEE